jgi:hypothetical protein
VAVTDDQVSVLRAMLANDFDLHERLGAQLDKANGWAGYPALVAAAFFEAANRRFGESYERADVVQFVAAARAQFDATGGEIHPAVAERLILSALEDEALDGLDEGVVAQLQVVLLGAMISLENLDDAGLDKFMADARDLADEWIASE